MEAKQKCLKEDIFFCNDEYLEEDSKDEVTISIGSSNEDLVCNYCGGIYHGKKALNNHLVYHKDDGNENECQFCQKKFKNKGLLSKHNSSVHSENIFSCEECSKKFTRLTNLIRHK